ncbi:hypothetical protein ND486_11595 [Pseudonocardia sp. DR1-2]|uniref:hypothetical protein n=1 Tax=Pseudonocardia sp. DR1-2 TaxID=2951168 RepID=UPI0020438334|nr:hypothetical protein [Pseudonocardia sp. DR1-2]MCM3846833.1 hypothetical protein [Pseudonocardia sp. DR1-2]
MYATLYGLFDDEETTVALDVVGDWAIENEILLEYRKVLSGEAHIVTLNVRTGDLSVDDWYYGLAEIFEVVVP